MGQRHGYGTNREISLLALLLVFGDADKVVPHKENSEIVYERYKALGGSVERIVKAGGGPNADETGTLC